MSSVMRTRRLHPLDFVLRRLSCLHTYSGHNVQMEVNDEEALAYLDRDGDPLLPEFARFVVQHQDAFKGPDVGKKAREVLTKYADDNRVVVVLIEVPKSDAPGLLDRIRQHQSRCPGMIVEIA